MNKQDNNSKTTIKLYCPTSSKMAEITPASDDQKLDIGKIALTFGIDPATLKLNGHFISRGVDLIASSVTWRSLLSFFSSKGLSTGFVSSSPLIVDGKISKPGSKRSLDPTEVTNTVPSARLNVKNPWQDNNIKSPDYKKMKETHNDCENKHQKEICSDIGGKRKHWLQNISPFKKSRVSGSFSNYNSRDHEQRENKRSSTLTNSNLPCGYMFRENVKRAREDEVLIGVTAPLKRAR